MPRLCTICQHSQRTLIEVALVGGTSYRTITDQFHVSKAALIRHKADHVPAHLAQAQQASEVAQADNLLAQVRGLQAKAVRILLTAEAQGDLRTALAAIREARGNLELLAKLLGELDERPVVNIVASPEWVALRTILMRALMPYAEARVAVAAALIEAEGSQHAAIQ